MWWGRVGSSVIWGPKGGKHSYRFPPLFQVWDSKGEIGISDSRAIIRGWRWAQSTGKKTGKLPGCPRFVDILLAEAFIAGTIRVPPDPTIWRSSPGGPKLSPVHVLSDGREVGRQRNLPIGGEDVSKCAWIVWDCKMWPCIGHIFSFWFYWLGRLGYKSGWLT